MDAEEGRAISRMHRGRERSRKLVERKKASFLAPTRPPVLRSMRLRFLRALRRVGPGLHRMRSHTASAESAGATLVSITCFMLPFSCYNQKA